MKVFLSYSTNSHFDETRQEFAEFLSKEKHKLLTVDSKDPVIPIFEQENVEVISKVDTSSYNANFFSLLSVFDKSDLIVFFPGGLNTIWMLSSVLHHAYYGKINKPIIIVNLDGFFNSFIDTIKVSLHEEPLFKTYGNWYYVADDLFATEELVSKLSSLKLLNSVVSIGDYVDYPVEYENITLPNGQETKLTGWQVINIMQNHVQLISAGTPLSLSFSKKEKIHEFISKLKSTSFNEFSENGFGSKLLKVLSNKYTLYFDIFSYEDIRPNCQNFPFYNGTDVYIPAATENLYLLRNDKTFADHVYGTYGIRIVVTLKSDTITTGRDANKIWLLS